MLHDLDVGPNDVVSYLLPNLPQTHYTLWGAEAAGIANPINPMLEPKAIVDICSTVKTKVLVTLGDTTGTDIWEKARAARKELPDLEHVICVSGRPSSEKAIIDFNDEIKNTVETGFPLPETSLPRTLPPFTTQVAPRAGPSWPGEPTIMKL